jgi:hypothetical protein
MRRKELEDQPSFIRYNRGPIVSLGPSAWIQEHVGNQCLVNALQCDDIFSSAVKAIPSYIRQSGRRASIIWSKLLIDGLNTDAEKANEKIDQLLVSEF